MKISEILLFFAVMFTTAGADLSTSSEIFSGSAAKPVLYEKMMIEYKNRCFIFLFIMIVVLFLLID